MGMYLKSIWEEETAVPKRFCVTGACIPEKNYMVDINQMVGNPYKLTKSTTQKSYFEIREGFHKEDNG